MSVADLLIKAYARKYGINEEEAKAVLSPILSDENKLDKFRKLLIELGETANALSNLPEDVRPVAASILTSDLMRRDEDDMRELRKLARDALLIRLILGDVFLDNNVVKKLEKEIETIREEFRKLTESFEEKRNERERKKMLKILKMFEKRIRDIEKRVSEGGGNDELKAEISKIRNDMNRMIDIFRKVSSGEGSKLGDVLYELVPVIVEYLKNPHKIKELADTLASIGSESTGKKIMERGAGIKQRSHILKTSRNLPPKLEEFLEGGSNGEEKG